MSSSHLAIACVSPDISSAAAVHIPRPSIWAAVGELRQMSARLAGQHGAIDISRSSEGDAYLFGSADSAARFALLLSRLWGERSVTGDAVELPIRLACHFGECERLGPIGDWLGRGLSTGRRMADSARAEDIVVASATFMDLLDPAHYIVEDGGERTLPGDSVRARPVFYLRGFTVDNESGLVHPPKTAEGWYLRGAAMASTMFESTEVEAFCYEQALRLDPDYAEAHNNLGVVRRAQGDLSAAEGHYRRALELRGPYAEALLNLAIVLMERGQDEDALRGFRQVLIWRPGSTSAHHGLANLMRRRGEYHEARLHYQQALELAPATVPVRNDLAILLEDTGQTHQALAQYHQALTYDPRSAETHYNLALLLDRLGRPEEAERHYHQALVIRPQFPEAANNLGVMLQASGRLDEAERQYRSVLELRPHDPEAHYNLALLLAQRESGGQPTAGPIGGPAPPSGPGNLSQREAEVLTLLALGESNRQIADRLVLSVHTVDRHVANIYAKIGARGRADATAYAIRQGLLPVHRSHQQAGWGNGGSVGEDQ